MHKALGKGLESLISNVNMRDTTRKETLMVIPIDKIKPNKYQARITFNQETLKELADSIKKYGLAQPILVSPSVIPGEYELIAGERRVRACRMGKVKDIPAVVKKVSEKEKFQLSLIENIQRDNLNSVEEAEAFNAIMKEFDLTQEDIAEMLGIGRSKIANTLRLLHLPEYIIEAIKEGHIPSGHARALVVLEDPAKQKELAKRIIKEKLTTREVEHIVQTWKQAIGSGKIKVKKKKSPEVIEIENQLQRIMGTKVIIKGRKNKGWINIAFYSLDHFDTLISTLKGKHHN